jgi:hypothetical protein
MNGKPFLRSAAQWSWVALGLAVATYGTYVGLTWSRYGTPARSRPDQRDELLDQFMPTFDVVERHHVTVNAPAAVTLAAARTMELWSLPIVHAIFKGRELILGASPDRRPRPKGLVDQVLALGWVVLVEIPDREIVFGSVTKPWEPDVTFRSVSPDAFAAFDEAGYVKIAWTLRADALDAHSSMFRTETRAVATDSSARAKFRWYWSFLSPGIILIRRMSLRPVKKEAERQRGSAARRSWHANHFTLSPPARPRPPVITFAMSCMELTTASSQPSPW